jgi:hypothetical protein
MSKPALPALRVNTERVHLSLVTPTAYHVTAAHSKRTHLSLLSPLTISGQAHIHIKREDAQSISIQFTMANSRTYTVTSTRNEAWTPPPASEDWEAEIVQAQPRLAPATPTWLPPPPSEDWDAELEFSTPQPAKPSPFAIHRWRPPPVKATPANVCASCGHHKALQMDLPQKTVCRYCNSNISHKYWAVLKHVSRCPKLPTPPEVFLRDSCRCNQHR